MPRRLRTPTIDPDLQVIATLERAIVEAFDQRHQIAGTSAAEIARQRPEVVRIAVLLAEGLRAELAARRQG
jgi:hypothetical protein